MFDYENQKRKIRKKLTFTHTKNELNEAVTFIANKENILHAEHNNVIY